MVFLCKSKCIDITEKCKSLESDVQETHNQFLKVKRHASDLQAFVASNDINEKCLKMNKKVKEVMAEVRTYTIGTTINPIISSFIKEAKFFGDITSQEVQANLPISDPTSLHAQFQLQTSQINFYSKNLNLFCSIKIDEISSNDLYITGSSMSNDGKIYVANSYDQMFECDSYEK